MRDNRSRISRPYWPLIRTTPSIWSRVFAMADKPIDPLTYDHLKHFGTIIHSFARIELLIQSTLGRLVRLAGGSDDTVEMVIIITKPMNYSQKRDALTSFLAIYKISEPTRSEITKLFDT